MPMKTRAVSTAAIILVAAAIAGGGCSSSSSSAPSSESPIRTTAFRSAAAPAPAGWTGPTFALSKDFPASLPPLGDAAPWLAIDVDFADTNPGFTDDKKWPAYMQAILNYVRSGQDAQLSDAEGFRVQVDGKTRWFHMPWMSANDTSGREFIHGMTNERTTTTDDLNGDGNPDGGFFETWAFGMYNDIGGYTLGQAIDTEGRPVLVPSADGKPLVRGLPFAKGTCVAKMLFTSADEMNAPFLKGAPAWQVHRHKGLGGSKFSCVREVQTSRLFQMDVAVVDPRSPSNWVLGTFAYNGNVSAASPWDRLVPLGIQFGNDPDLYPATADKTTLPKESILNPVVGIYEHFGCNKRLNGPADNRKSACNACHGSAFTAPLDVADMPGKTIPPVFGYSSQCATPDATNALFFGNRKYPERVSAFPDAIPLDFSLQLAVAFGQYKAFVASGKAIPCTL
jgi:hypothetical protein